MNGTNTFASVKTIFFDIGDTLYTNEAMEKAYPQKLVELLSSSRGIPLENARTLLEETTEKLKATVKHVTKVRAMAELGFTREEAHEAFCKVDPKGFLGEDPELDQVMSRLAVRYRLGIISNFKHSHVIEILDALGLSPKWFPLLVTEDIVQEVKPHPEPFLKAIELSGCAPEECVYIGDSPTKDMEPAKSVGMRTILVSKDSLPEVALYADAIIPDVKKILEVLEVS